MAAEREIPATQCTSSFWPLVFAFSINSNAVSKCDTKFWFQESYQGKVKEIKQQQRQQQTQQQRHNG
eukprot:m.93623 g.93623  ORF g.93623 m.93623 type:complete len:67 (+) comp21797_c1_seq5:278-478(+)